MTNDGKIYIVITDKAPAEAGGNAVRNTSSNKKNEEQDTLFNHWARNHILSTVKNAGKQAINYSINNIGNFTGNYMTQTHVNEALNNIGGLMNIGATALAGFNIAGPIGAIVGASLGVINQSVSSVLSINTRMIENNKTNYEIEQLRIRAGLNGLYDGSRGTEN